MHGCLGLYSVDGQRETNVRSALYRHSLPLSCDICEFLLFAWIKLKEIQFS
jgi:hypothetical protein